MTAGKEEEVSNLLLFSLSSFKTGLSFDLADTTPVKRQDSSSGSARALMSGTSSAIKNSAGSAWSKIGGVFSKLTPQQQQLQQQQQQQVMQSSPRGVSGTTTTTTGWKSANEMLFPTVGEDNNNNNNNNTEPLPHLDSASYDESQSHPHPSLKQQQKGSVHSEGELAAALEKERERERERETTQILNKDLKTSTYLVPSTVLFRYPSNVDPPPVELCDFCMPIGAKMQQIICNNRPDDDNNIIQDIFFGYNHGKRSGRSFLFMIEDKTIAPSDDMSNIGKIGRLYGICVIHPRFMRSNVIDPHKKSNKKPFSNQNQYDTSDSMNRDSQSNNPGASLSSPDQSSSSAAASLIEFESLVCYAFITRFPFFDFFFQVLYDIIALEKLKRFELTSTGEDTNYEISKKHYEYLPSDLLSEVLERLSKIPPPKFGSSFSFQLDQDLQPITFHRSQYNKNPNKRSSSSSYKQYSSWMSDEYLNNLSEWCLPTLFSWVPPDLLVWCIGLLLLETKIIVVGNETGLVSSVVLGLLTLIKPFEWVSPVIPMLPIKLTEFIESPVPILVGMVLDPLDNKTTGSTILKQCSDSSGIDGAITTVLLDLTKTELILCSSRGDSFHTLCLAGAMELATTIESRLRGSENTWNDFSHRTISNDVYQQHLLQSHHSHSHFQYGSNPPFPHQNNPSSSPPFTGNTGTAMMTTAAVSSKNRPIYHPTSGHKNEAKLLQKTIYNHLEKLGRESIEMKEKVALEKEHFEEKLLRLSFSTQEGGAIDFSESDSDSENNNSEDGENDDSEEGSSARNSQSQQQQQQQPQQQERKNTVSGFLEKTTTPFYRRRTSSTTNSINNNPAAKAIISEDEKKYHKTKFLKKHLLSNTFHRLDGSHFPPLDNKIEFFARMLKTQVWELCLFSFSVFFY
jgi:hypothetical protein